MEKELVLAILKLLQLAKREHYACDDPYYSCPKAPEGYAQIEGLPKECNCEADKINAEIDEIKVIIKKHVPEINIEGEA